MTVPRITAVIVAYRSGDQLARCVESVFLSESVSIRVLLVNNEPADDTPRLIEDRFASVTLYDAGSNIGFCRAVNLGLQEAADEYVMLLNPDAWVSPDFARRVVDVLESDGRIGSAGGSILRSSASDPPELDSLGLTMLPGRRPADLAHGERRRPGAGVREVFGVTAAAAMYRRSALQATAVGGDILPGYFFMYMDDVDLAWRLRLKGYTSFVDRGAIAHHERSKAGTSTPETSNLVIRKLLSAKREAEIPAYIRYLSWSNHLLMLVRNDDASLFLAQLPLFAVRRLPLETFTILTSPAIAIEARRRFAKYLPLAWKERRVIHGTRVVGPAEMRRWLN